MQVTVPALPRILAQHRGFAACVIISLGLGIAAAAAAIAVADSIDHARLPFRNADRLEILYVQNRADPNVRYWSMSPDVLRAVTAGASPVTAVARYQVKWATLRDDSHLAEGMGADVSANFARVLGIRVALGRALDASDMSGPPAVMISHALWQRKLGGDSSIIGRTIQVGDVPRVVVGVAAEDWEYPEQAAFWTADLDLRSMRAGDVFAIVQLASSVPRDRARAMLRTLGTNALSTDPRRRHGYRVESMGFRDYLTASRLRGVIVALTVIAIFVGFITAVNFAGLVLARGIRRRAELGVRAALGASVPRLAWHVIAESLALCAAGGLLAAILAPVLLAFLRNSFSTILPAWLPVTLSWRTVIASVGIATTIGLLFALGPALDLARPALAGYMQAAAGTSSSGAGAVRTRAWLVAIQVALATGVLVTLGAVLGRSLVIMRPSLGFDPAPIITGYVASAPRPEVPFELLNTSLYNVRETPGVVAAGVAASRNLVNTELLPEGGVPNAADAFRDAKLTQVTDGYFRAIQPRLVAGRFPTPDEELHHAPVAVLSAVVAHRWFGDHAIGKIVRVGDGKIGTPVPLSVVGVIDDVNRDPVFSEAYPIVYTPTAHVPTTRTASFEMWIRTSGSVGKTLRTLEQRDARHQLGADILDLAPLANSVRASIAAFNGFKRFVFAIFGLALGLAALGIYGLVAYTAEMRMRELAIREALGATRYRVIGLLLRSAAIQATIGVAVGAVLSTVAAAFMSTPTHVIQPAVGTTAVTLAIVALTVLLSSAGPLREAWKRDLAATLRQ